MFYSGEIATTYSTKWYHYFLRTFKSSLSSIMRSPASSTIPGAKKSLVSLKVVKLELNSGKKWMGTHIAGAWCKPKKRRIRERRLLGGFGLTGTMGARTVSVPALTDAAVCVGFAVPKNWSIL